MEMETCVPQREEKIANHRWCQYSLRTLLFFVTFCAVVCSWCAVKMQQARNQQEAVEAIRRLGGSVRYDYEGDAETAEKPPPGPAWLRGLVGVDFLANVVEASLDRPQIKDADLGNLKGLRHLQGLSLAGTKISDTGLMHLRGFSDLQALSLAGTQVSDAGLIQLNEMTRLQGLSLLNTRITDAGLVHLRKMTNLQALSLAGTRVTDGGLRLVKELIHIRELHLDNTRISDTGLGHLRDMKQLRYLRLVNTRVTRQGIRQLQQALPDCRVDEQLGEKKGISPIIDKLG
jgi:hypothetical protein